jgi:cyanophycin synthetase
MVISYRKAVHGASIAEQGGDSRRSKAYRLVVGGKSKVQPEVTTALESEHNAQLAQETRKRLSMLSPLQSLLTVQKMADIALQRIRYLRGPNVWTYRPVLEVWLELGELENFPSQLLPGFNQRLLAMLPALTEHHCGVGERGGFVQRLEAGTWAGHILEHVVIELLNLARMPTGFGQTRSTSQPGQYRMVFRARDEQVARVALAQGHRLLMSAINSEAFDVSAAVAAVCEIVDDSYLGPSTACIVAAATDRKIPHIRLNDGNLVQLGYGASQRRIWTAESELTSAIAEGIASDKNLTKSLLASCGVPVPHGQVVASDEEAWEAAQEIGTPVVIKPTDGNHGRGVTMNLHTHSEVQAAFAVALRHGSEVMVERMVQGDEHRLLVVGGRVVAAAKGESAWVVGDGHHTVVALVDQQLNIDPRRGVNEDFPLSVLRPQDDAAILIDLQRQGLTPESVPEPGQRVLIQHNGNVSIDCTDQVHPEVARLVSLAARTVGLDIAGVDVVAQDISKPLQAQGGAVVEVNAGPGLLMHLKPAVGSPRPVGRAVVDHLFAESESGRIPIVGVAGSKNTHTMVRLIGWLMHLSGRKVGLACRDGLFLDRRRVESGNCAAWEPAHRLLINRSVQAAVIENGAHTILQDGLPYDRCQIGVVTDSNGWESLSEFDISEPEQMSKVLRTQVDVVLPDGVAVLNGADPKVAALAALCDGSVILYATGSQCEPLMAHRAAGGRAVFAREGHMVLATGNAEVVLGSLRRQRGLGDDRLQTQLASVAVAWALGISMDLIAAGIETFEWHLRESGGR